MRDQQRTALCGRQVDSCTLGYVSVTVHRNTRNYMKYTEVLEMSYQATAYPNVIKSAVDV